MYCFSSSYFCNVLKFGLKHSNCIRNISWKNGESAHFTCVKDYSNYFKLFQIKSMVLNLIDVRTVSLPKCHEVEVMADLQSYNSTASAQFPHSDMNCTCLSNCVLCSVMFIQAGSAHIWFVKNLFVSCRLWKVAESALHLVPVKRNLCFTLTYVLL